jgi:hypothetical protein
VQQAAPLGHCPLCHISRTSADECRSASLGERFRVTPGKRSADGNRRDRVSGDPIFRSTSAKKPADTVEGPAASGSALLARYGRRIAQGSRALRTPAAHEAGHPSRCIWQNAWREGGGGGSLEGAVSALHLARGPRKGARPCGRQQIHEGRAPALASVLTAQSPSVRHGVRRDRHATRLGQVD